MKTVLFALLFSASVGAQSVSFFIDTSNGALPTSQLSPLPAAYQFASTPTGGASAIVVRVVNVSTSAVTLGALFVGNAANSSVANQNFSITGFDQGATLASQAWKLFTLSFTPATLSPSAGYLQVLVGTKVSAVSTLTGTATAPQLTLSCSGPPSQCSGGLLQPNSPTPLNFGNVLTTTSVTVSFTLSNGGSVALNPQALLSLTSPTNNPNSAFSLGTLPNTLPANSAITFSLVFAPGTVSTFQTTLMVGPNPYLLQGSGTASVLGDISSLVITYVDSTGVRLTAQPGSAINFGQIVSGVNASSSLTFIVSNPQTTINPVAVPNLTVAGAGFASSFTAAPVPPCASTSLNGATIQPGQCISFQVALVASSTGTYNGTLSIGTRQFSLTGQTVASLVPPASFQLSQPTLMSQQQVALSINFASASPVIAIGTLSMEFASSIANVTDDPSIVFIATSGRQLQMTLAAGGQTATYNGQPSVTFQTGTTAGTLTFTLKFPNSAPFTQSFTIAPAQVQITSSTAVRQSPNLVVTLNGYDNTYSVGQLSFTFYDTSGKLLTPNGIAVNAASNFHQYFFGPADAGGAFAVQASFPVSGDVTQVGSVAVSLANSAGSTSATQAFQ